MGRSSPASKAILFEKWYQEARHTLNVCREVLKTSGFVLGFQPSLNLLTAISRNTPRSYFLVHVPCYIFFHRPTVFGFGQSADDRPIVHLPGLPLIAFTNLHHHQCENAQISCTITTMTLLLLHRSDSRANQEGQSSSDLHSISRDEGDRGSGPPWHGS